MSLLIYISKVLVISVSIYLYYRISLCNRKFHRYNRFYLLGLFVFSMALPLITIPLHGLMDSKMNGPIRLLSVIRSGSWESEVVIYANRNLYGMALNWQYIAMAVYFAVTLVLALLGIQSLVHIRRIRRKYSYEECGDIRIFQTREPGTPFSFLQEIFWNQNLDIESAEGQKIFRHEWFHIKEKHSYDLIFAEIACTLFWFNPIFHLARRELKTIHEFLADQYAAKDGNDLDYAELLVWQTLNRNRQVAIVHPFFQNQIKRRIMMITKFSKARSGYAGRVMALPLFVALFFVFAFRAKDGLPTGHPAKSKSLTIIVDAGHGGIDQGALGPQGQSEKEITLAIAKKMAQYGKDYNIKVVLTRDRDILPGNASTITEGLENRISIAASAQADLFISLHVNANTADPHAEGFEVWLGSGSPFYNESARLGSAVAQEVSRNYVVLPELKESSNVFVLLSPKMPSILVECGYITNSKDLGYISIDENQSVVARDILEAVVKFQTSKPVQSQTLQKSDTVPAVVRSQNPDDLQKTYSKVEVESEYPGGQDAWIQYLIKNVVYPPDAVKKNIQGKVVVQFIVYSDGHIGDVKVLESPDQSLSQEAIRIIKKSGLWTPAIDHGKQVNAYKRQPIIFKLQAK